MRRREVTVDWRAIEVELNRLDLAILDADYLYHNKDDPAITDAMVRERDIIIDELRQISSAATVALERLDTLRASNL
jgi:NAD-dependent DNA ligase